MKGGNHQKELRERSLSPMTEDSKKNSIGTHSASESPSSAASIPSIPGNAVGDSDKNKTPNLPEISQQIPQKVLPPVQMVISTTALAETEKVLPPVQMDISTTTLVETDNKGTPSKYTGLAGNRTQTRTPKDTNLFAQSYNAVARSVKSYPNNPYLRTSDSASHQSRGGKKVSTNVISKRKNSIIRPTGSFRRNDGH